MSIRASGGVRFLASKALLALVISTAVMTNVALASARHDRPARAPISTVEVVQTTSDLSQRLTRLADRRFGSSPVRGVRTIHVDERVRYQRITGFGAAMTDTSAWLLKQLPLTYRAVVMSKLFGAHGIRLGVVRVPMGASDFTKDGGSYSYDDLPPGQADQALAQFSIVHDDAYIVPVLREMRAINVSVNIIASPWSPPAWMKTNGSLDNVGNAAGLLPSAYAPLAGYFVKFLEAYANRGIRVEAVTPQNEPGQQAAYPGLDWPERGQMKWIVKDLAPALRMAGLRTRVYGHDSTWAGHSYARALASDPQVGRAISGIAWHCYVGNPGAMTRLHVVAPRLDQIVTECSTGISPGPAASLLIASLRNWSSAVLLWNLALDPNGGPVQQPNEGCGGCTGLVTVDERRGTVTYLRDYYQLGQASSFIKRGARRIGSNTFVTYNSTVLNRGPSYGTTGLDNVAFENPDGSKVLLVYNSALKPERFAVASRGRLFRHQLPPGGTATFIWDQAK